MTARLHDALIAKAKASERSVSATVRDLIEAGERRPGREKGL
jgi:hypothetical protein